MAFGSSIIFNGRFLQRPVTGVERFAIETLRALDGLISSGEIKLGPLFLAVPRGTQAKVSFNHIQLIEVGRFQGYAWEQIELPWFAGRRLLVNLCNTGPVCKRHQAVVIHDAAVFSVPQAYGMAFRLVYKCMHRLLAWRGARILTVSEFSRQELARHLHIAAESIAVLPEGGEHVLRVLPDDGILTKADLLKRPFVLAVSSAQANKNFAFVAQALAPLGDPGFDVVVAGGTNPAVFAAKGAALPPFVKHVGYVSDAELASLYMQAACFVFPSLYEGFGIPPLEAMARGCPVVASNAASIPEVCGPAAVYFDPVDPSSFLDALHQVMGSEPARVQLKVLAQQRSQLWTWPRAARSLLQALPEQVPTHP
ncbi:MAG: glycosyltransferase family 1 protein [Aquabacterium sp.]|uniref:glycosyltransferase family 4 protein n=1 Tax=Aquabacterium sp. TaxID=1872578 RepID=UPI002721365B|nr:glycosyltransferase family 1 protein [Aquabacterium sp.]MDO9002642.1 glycosyltransferase family 1 protein [Aquabacterium sp.]